MQVKAISWPRPSFANILVGVALVVFAFYVYVRPKAVATSAESVVRATNAAHKLTGEGEISCFVYDRPPRTGSTTMMMALKACVEDQLGFKQPEYIWTQEANEQVSRMFERVTGLRRALVTKHLHFVPEDVRLIRTGCKNLLYVTSCMPMYRRIWSRQKYKFYKGNDNFTLTQENHEVAEKRVFGEGKYELKMERHPWLDREANETMLDKRKRLVPDYVVRNGPGGLYGEDLRNLLQALGCGGNFTTMNVHKNKHEGEVLEKIQQKKIRMGDQIYRQLMKLGRERNGQGLHKARAFVAVAFRDEE